MPSNKPKVFAYLPQPLYDQVEVFKIERGLNSDSQALIAILSEYFGSEIIDHAKSNNAIEKLEIALNQYQISAKSLIQECDRRIRALEVRWNLETRTNPAYTIEVPAEAVEETTGSVPSELEETIGSVPSKLEETIGSVPSKLEETISSVPSKLEETIGSVPSKLEETISSVPSKLEETISSVPESSNELNDGISQLSLAQRLGCTNGYIRKVAKQNKLEEWSKQKDPEQIGWELRGKKYYPKSLQLQESAM